MHVAVVSSPVGDGGIEKVQIYLDGVDYMMMPVSLADAAAACVFLMGGEGSGTSDLMGIVDEVTIYNTTLTPAQVQGIYAAGTAGKCPCLGNAQCAGGKPTCVNHFCQWMAIGHASRVRTGYALSRPVTRRRDAPAYRAFAGRARGRASDRT